MKEAMQFVRAQHRLLYFIVESNPLIGPYFKSKVYLEDADMRIWDRMNTIPSVALLITKERKK